ncbi:MAG TPA: type II toxin-antitoxin system prevent-host-death family antitoxin [Candidatus Kapabacteria bacterium]|nr:type II toxin-antitoxin system prevent-host-death family antitoxin [Candidatus Kapabacteria bacterium]
MHQISIEEATAHIASVFGEAMRGEEIVITDHEKPVVKVVPFKPERRKGSTPGRAIGMISYIADDFDETPPGFEEYM